jgi:hypothetical protein
MKPQALDESLAPLTAPLPEKPRRKPKPKRKSKLKQPARRKKKFRGYRSIGIGIGLGRHGHGDRRVPALDGPLMAVLDDRVMTFAEWCQLNGIGIRTGRRILRGSDPPQVLQLTERRIGITVRANREWQQRRLQSRSTP